MTTVGLLYCMATVWLLYRLLSVVIFVDAVIWICLVWSGPTYSLLEGPKAKCYAPCWNQLVPRTDELYDLFPVHDLDLPYSTVDIQ